jgi:hypothetical protein
MKRIAIRIIIVIGILFLIIKSIEWWLEHNFEATINSNPERAYNITYSDFDLDTFFKGITLDEVRIEPLNKTEGSIIIGHVDYATINGLVWRDLLFSKKLGLEEVTFKDPTFEVTLSADSTKKADGRGMQNLFGDILSRANVKRFSIQNGSVEIKEKSTGNIKASLKSLNVEARDILTDSLHWKHIIPFQLGELKITIDSVDVHLNAYTNLSLGHFRYDLKKKEIILNDISLDYSIDWVNVSQKLGFQNDIIELNLQEVAIHNLQPSSEFYTRLDIVAEKISIDSLDIKLRRNKNINRPPDQQMPMFNGIIEGIPLAFKLDSLQITNSTVSYSELGVKKHESGTVKFNEINGLISNITNVPENQAEWKQMTANINSKIATTAIKVSLNMPYDREFFALNVDVGAMNLNVLNPTLKPLAGVEIESGQMQRIHYTMDAGKYVSKNKLIFDYNDLHLDLIKENADKKEKKLVIKSLIANSAVRNNNIPGDKKYLTAKYESTRNMYRSPVNYIIQGLIHGFTRIVPGKGIQKLIN